MSWGVLTARPSLNPFHKYAITPLISQRTESLKPFLKRGYLETISRVLLVISSVSVLAKIIALLEVKEVLDQFTIGTSCSVIKPASVYK